MKNLRVYLMLVLALGFFHLKAETPKESTKALEKSGQTRLNNLTIIVSSCDAYSDFWPPFFKLLARYWPTLQTTNQHVPIILITDQKKAFFKGVTVYHGGAHRTWSENMQGALKKVTTPYVLYLQEDYLFCKPVNEKLLKQLLILMEQHALPYIQVGEDSHAPAPLYAKTSLKNLFQKNQDDAYLTCLNAALWKTDVLRDLLHAPESAWDFEHQATLRARNKYTPFLYLGFDFPLAYINACYRGFLIKDAQTFLKTENIQSAIRLPLEANNIEAWKYPLTTRMLQERGIPIKIIYPHEFTKWDRLLFNIKRAFWRFYKNVKSILKLS